MSENLHVYAATCSWHGPISEVGTMKLPATEATIGGKKVMIGGEDSYGLPCCPHCQSVLFQMDEDKFWRGALEHQQKGHTNYETFLRWTMTQKRCWPTLAEAAAAYTLESSRPVVLKK